MVEGQPERNVLRAGFTWRTIAERLQLSEELRSAHFYALLLKEAGCSSNTSKVTAHFSAENIGVKKNFNTVHWSLRRLTGGRGWLSVAIGQISYRLLVLGRRQE